MPTRPENLYSAEISTDRYKEYSCPNLISEIESLIIYETNLSRAQQKRIDDSQGHAVYYGWGKGDGMDTVELVKARGKIIAIRREMKTKGCN